MEDELDTCRRWGRGEVCLRQERDQNVGGTGKNPDRLELKLRGDRVGNEVLGRDEGPQALSAVIRTWILFQ